jgi:hypothetical protein
MAAWSELEHDMFLYQKDNAMYVGLSMARKHPFHGYVEPVTGFFGSLAYLVRKTRISFRELNSMVVFYTN